MQWRFKESLRRALLGGPSLAGKGVRRRFLQKAIVLSLSLIAPAIGDAHSVISLNLCTDQLLVLLAPEQVAALEPLARDPSLSFVARQAAKLPIVRADAEAVMSLHPDLILAGKYGAQGTLALLRGRGARVVQVDEPADFLGVAKQVEEIAALLGVGERGARLVAEMGRVLAGVHKRTGTAVLWEAGGWSAGHSGIEDAVLRAAGLTNVGTGGRMGLELLLARHPDLLVAEQAAAFPSMATNLVRHPALEHLARRTVPPALLACAGPFSAQAVEIIAR